MQPCASQLVALQGLYQQILAVLSTVSPATLSDQATVSAILTQPLMRLGGAMLQYKECGGAAAAYVTQQLGPGLLAAVNAFQARIEAAQAQAQAAASSGPTFAPAVAHAHAHAITHAVAHAPTVPCAHQLAALTPLYHHMLHLLATVPVSMASNQALLKQTINPPLQQLLLALRAYDPCNPQHSTQLLKGLGAAVLAAQARFKAAVPAQHHAAPAQHAVHYLPAHQAAMHNAARIVLAHQSARQLALQHGGPLVHMPPRRR